MFSMSRGIAVITLALTLAAASGEVFADQGHDHNDTQKMMDTMQKMHQGHQHGHDFEAMQEMAPEQWERMINLMRDVGLVVPQMDASNGRKLFAVTGCIVCHSVNGVGGEIGPSLNAADMPSPMNAFEFAARMWRGAASMTAMQDELLGDVINLTGQQLADLVAFAHDDAEQKKLTAEQIPKRFRKLLNQ